MIIVHLFHTRHILVNQYLWTPNCIWRTRVRLAKLTTMLSLIYKRSTFLSFVLPLPLYFRWISLRRTTRSGKPCGLWRRTNVERSCVLSCTNPRRLSSRSLLSNAAIWRRKTLMANQVRISAFYEWPPLLAYSFDVVVKLDDWTRACFRLRLNEKVNKRLCLAVKLDEWIKAYFDLRLQVGKLGWMNGRMCLCWFTFKTWLWNGTNEWNPVLIYLCVC